MTESRRDRDSTLEGLPDEWPVDLLSAIRDRTRADRRKVIVLDDDPTGTQTVHGVHVLTEWTAEALGAELADYRPATYVLTNSRSLPLAQARALNAEIGANLVKAARQAGRDFVVVSRSDSTLRGHFPGEVEALARTLGGDFDAWLLIPFFLEGGRYTISDVHYVAEGPSLVPAGQTEFARDATFGYQASNLREWVAEKAGGHIQPAAVSSISLDDIRRGGPPRVADRLAELDRGSVCVVNAASYRDLEVFTLGLLQAEAQGRRFLYRTAASFARVRAGIMPRGLLTLDDLDCAASGAGLFVVGSHVPRTTGQLESLLTDPQVTGVEISVEALLDDDGRPGEIERVVRRVDRHLESGHDTVVFTSRRLITAADAEGNLAVGRCVSSGLVAVIRGLTVRPRYLLAKGGITSSDLATEGLDVKRAEVRGQILPGVPVWQLGQESRYPGLAYIVFPGNVGGTEALADIAASLRG